MDSPRLLSLLYHNFFNYPLTSAELTRWQVSSRLRFSFRSPVSYQFSSGYYFLKGKHSLLKKRASCKIHSRQKLIIAKQAASVIKFIPTVKLLAITGSLTMNNSCQASDIDLLIITRPHTLWLTRPFVYLLLFLTRLPVRQPGRSVQKDKLCLNIWMDESDLLIRIQNLYTAHELAQIMPLINRGNAYQRLLYTNRWILSFWPNAVKITKSKPRNSKTNNYLFLFFYYLNFISYYFQLLYMQKKRTTELITPTRAFFHRTDWSQKVRRYLQKSGVHLNSFSS